MNVDSQKKRTEQIWRELSDQLRQFVQARVSSKADVDDLLQTVFLRIHSRSDQLQAVSRLKSWVFQIARNAIIDHYRKGRDQEYDDGSFVSDLGEAGSENANTEISKCLGTLIDRLPTDQQRALRLYELQGVSQKEIAARDSISLSGAKSRIQRGRKSLEAMLMDCCEFQFDHYGNVLDFQPRSGDCCTINSNENDSDGRCN